ncbi:related to allantoate permease [Serendipita indica DSM 11827]|uniref:Related to allantoate permease n=1 Tax=Serendipita indica (strain DSM 11827) TaxID=1109443 RepID=G4TS24_SERID|nr:related to allantoate permease [Serendipita indica DSM 11827]
MSEKHKLAVVIQGSSKSSAESFKDAKKNEAIFDERRSKNLLWKLDRNIVPFLSLLYLLSFLDRSNIGNARLANLESSLGMKGLDYNNALAIFFPFYVAAEVPSNMMLKRTKLSFWFALIMVLWALSTIVMAFPSINFYIMTWYRRHECGLRMAIFFSAATAAGAFGGLLARGISEMTGVGGLMGWSWIFILEGIVTFIVAIWAYFQIHDFPDTAKFLTEEERLEVHRRLREDRSGLAEEWHMKYVIQALTDWRYLDSYANHSCVSLFLPTIIKSMGYKNSKAQLMTVPPYVVACVFTISGGFLADQFKQRGIFMIGFCLLAIIGFTMLISTENVHIQYAGTFLAASGIYANIPGGVAWNSNNIGGSTKRRVPKGVLYVPLKPA